MNTLADVKRRVKPGVEVDVVNHHYAKLTGRRTIVDVQTKKFSMTIPGETRASWADFPKAADLRIDGPDTVTIMWDGAPGFTMTFVEAA